MTFRIALGLLVIMFIFTACIPGGESNGPEVGSIVPNGQPEIRDLSPTTETVPNCSGANTTTTKHPSMTVATSYAIEWEVGGEVGAGVTIGEGVVPGGVNLEGALTGAISSGLDSSIEQSSAWDLSAEPNTIREYTIMWREIWQPGFVNVILPTGENIQISVVYRSGIQSDIIGDRVLKCDGSQNIVDNQTSINDGVSVPAPTVSSPTAKPSTQENTSSTIGSNLIKNSGFEDALEGTGWEWGDRITLVDGYTGNFAASSVKSSDPGFGWVGLAQTIPVTAGKNYSFIAWLNWQNASQIHMKVLWYDDNLQELSSSFVMPGTDGTSSGWQKRGGVATAPAGATSATIYIWHGVKDNSSVPGSTVWIDEVIFSEVSP